MLLLLLPIIHTQSPGTLNGAGITQSLTPAQLFVFVYTVFLVHPTSIAAVDGSTVEFTCTANNTDIISYRVNGTSASLGSVISKGFNQLGAEELNTLVIRRNLSVTVSSLYNNTEILCEADGSPDVNSNTATLTVQGNTHVSI